MVTCRHKNTRGREGHGGRMLLGLYYHKPTQVERRAVLEIVCPEAYIVLEWEVLEVKGSVTKAIATGAVGLVATRPLSGWLKADSKFFNIAWLALGR